MALNWSSVKKENVERACQMILSGDTPARVTAKGIFVLFGQQHLPAKHVLRIAYCLANGLPMDTELRFSSGESTVKKLRNLGFEVEHKVFSKK